MLEVIPLSTLSKVAKSELASLSAHYPFLMLNVKQESYEEYQLLKSFSLTKSRVLLLSLVTLYLLNWNTLSLFTWSKQKWLFWRAGFYPANQRSLKSFQKSLIGWKKAGSLKKSLLFWSCKQAICIVSLFFFNKWRDIRL